MYIMIYTNEIFKISFSYACQGGNEIEKKERK